MSKVMLIILDGFGLNPIEKGNPLFEVETPTLDFLLKTSPYINLSASAESVGLSWGEVGNSEVGHSNIGTGQIIWQDLPRISSIIKNGSFFKNEVILKNMRFAKKKNSSLHLVGLISDGGIHSHLDHLFALMKMAKSNNLDKVFIHGFTDGRDTPPKCAKKFISAIEAKAKSLGIGRISTLSGRFYAMDRDNHWERIKKVYQVMTGDSAHVKKSPIEVIKDGYHRGQNDETIEPAIISLGKQEQFIRDDDAVIIFNFRADRSREITLALGQKDFSHFKRKRKLINLATMTPYETDWKMDIETIFGALKYEHTLSDLLAKNNISQLHMAETEKYAHVTYFFNGGREKEAKKEKYLCIPSPRVLSYAKEPEMSLNGLVSELLAQISKSNYQFVVVNFANADMVGHTGDFGAAKKAIISIDKNLQFLISKAKSAGYEIFLTADHGNVEQMINLETLEIDKEHTINPVFFLKIEKKYNEKIKFSQKEHVKLWSKICLESPKGVLADIPPTVSASLGLPVAGCFSGQSLLGTFK